MIGVEDSTDSSPNGHPGAIWLSLGLVEMSEPEEGASQEATATGLHRCDTSSTDYSKPYGWIEGTDHGTDITSCASSQLLFASPMFRQFSCLCFC